MKKKNKVLLLSLITTLGIISCADKINGNAIDNTNNIEINNEEILPRAPFGYKYEDGKLIRDNNIFIEIYNYAYVKYDTEMYNAKNEVIGYVNQYDKVYATATNDIITVIIREDGLNGYVYNNSIELMPKDFIEVDISEQKVNVYNNNENVLEADVVTGIPNHDTNIGYQEILEKTYNRPLIGPTWNVHVDYFFPFNYDGEGFHDASWRNNFGDDIYLTNGSHGCVNMNLDDVKEMDKYIEVGTKVLVHK